MNYLFLIFQINSPFQYTMDFGTNSTSKDINKKVTVDFQYFITLAIQKELSWKMLEFFLTDLTTTLAQSKEVIRLLVKELEISVTKSGKDVDDITFAVEYASNTEDTAAENNVIVTERNEEFTTDLSNEDNLEVFQEKYKIPISQCQP